MRTDGQMENFFAFTKCTFIQQGMLHVACYIRYTCYMLQTSQWDEFYQIGLVIVRKESSNNKGVGEYLRYSLEA